MNVMETAKIMAARMRFRLGAAAVFMVRRSWACRHRRATGCELRYRRRLEKIAGLPKRAALAAVLLAATIGGGLNLAGAPAPASAGSPVPGAPNCPMFPADNVWNTN